MKQGSIRSLRSLTRNFNMEVPKFSTLINEAIVNVALMNITFKKVMNIFGIVTLSLPEKNRPEVVAKIQQTLYKSPDPFSLPKPPLLLNSVFQKNFRKVISDMVEKEILDVIIKHFAPKSSMTVDSIITITQENLPYIVVKIHHTVWVGEPLEVPEKSQDTFSLKNRTAIPGNSDFLSIKITDITKTKSEAKKRKRKLPADKSEKIQEFVVKKGKGQRKAIGRKSSFQQIQSKPKKSKPNKKGKRDAFTESLDLIEVDSQDPQRSPSNLDQVKTEIIDHDYSKAYGENVPEADDRVVMKGDDFEVVCEGDSESEDIEFNNESQELYPSNEDESIDPTETCDTAHNTDSIYNSVESPGNIPDPLVSSTNFSTKRVDPPSDSNNPPTNRADPPSNDSDSPTNTDPDRDITDHNIDSSDLSTFSADHPSNSSNNTDSSSDPKIHDNPSTRSQAGHNKNAEHGSLKVEYQNIHQLLQSKTSASNKGTKARKKGSKARNEGTEASNEGTKTSNEGTKTSNEGTKTSNEGAEAVILGTVTKVKRKNGENFMSFKASKVGTVALENPDDDDEVNDLTDNTKSTGNQAENKAPEEISIQFIKCRDCPEIFKNKNAFLLHAPVCYYNNQYPKLLNSKRHHMFHLPIDPKKPLINCDTCGEIFANKQDLVSHQEKEKHKGKLERVLCRYCPMTFPCKDYCSRHERLKHKVYALGNHQCKYCSKRFKNVSEFKRHVKLYCAKFHEQFSDIHSDSDSDDTQSTSHDNTSEDGKTYECKYCSKAFHNRKQCEKHERIHERLQQEQVSLNPDRDVAIEECDSNKTQMIDSPGSLANQTESLSSDVHMINTTENDITKSDDDSVIEAESTDSSHKKTQSKREKKIEMIAIQAHSTKKENQSKKDKTSPKDGTPRTIKQRNVKCNFCLEIFENRKEFLRHSPACISENRTKKQKK